MRASDIYEKLSPPISKRRYVFIAIPIICGLVLWLWWQFFSSSVTYTYRLASPITTTITQIVSAAGTLSPIDTVEVGSQISGRIQDVLVDINDQVKQGQVLARINPEKLYQTLHKQQASLASARAQYELALITQKQKQWNYERLSELYKRTNGKSPSTLELHNAQLEYESAKSNSRIQLLAIKNIQTDVASSEIDVKNAIIISPIDGIVLERSIDPGQTVAASFQTPTLFTIAKSLDQMSLVVNVAESDIGKVQAGQQVRFTVDAYPNRDFVASVDRVSYAATEDSTNNIISYKTRILVDNHAKLLRPGMSASANIIIQTQENAKAIPVSALFFEPPKQASKRSFSFGAPPPPRSPNVKKPTTAKKTIYLLRDGIPMPLDVEIGITDGINVQILSPLPDNASIITQAVKAS